MKKLHIFIGDIRLAEPLKRKLVSELEISPNGLILCKIKFWNILDKVESPIVCKALVDTGAEISSVSEDIFKTFSIPEHRVVDGNLIDLFGSIKKVKKSYLHFRIPIDNWHGDDKLFAIMDFTYSEEFKAIIGMDILRDYELVYKGLTRQAFLYEY